MVQHLRYNKGINRWTFFWLLNSGSCCLQMLPVVVKQICLELSFWQICPTKTRRESSNDGQHAVDPAGFSNCCQVRPAISSIGWKAKIYPTKLSTHRKYVLLDQSWITSYRDQSQTLCRKQQFRLWQWVGKLVGSIVRGNKSRALLCT